MAETAAPSDITPQGGPEANAPARSRDSHNVVGFETVFDDELQAVIAKRRGDDGKPEKYNGKRALDLELVGLALSGGGIRSASFNLGLLQSLGRAGILAQCDYLSTVSGGGYIGSCLSSLCSTPGFDATRERLPFRFNGKEENAAIKHLRGHSDYLAPHHGLFKRDTWMLVAAYLRGLFLSLVTVNALLGVAAAIGILLVSFAVWFLHTYAVRWMPADVVRFWAYPQGHLRVLFAPGALLAVLWLIANVLYLFQSVSASRWKIAYRDRFTKWQARFLRASIMLLAIGALPLLLAWVDTLSIATLYSSAVGASAVSLARTFILGDKAKDTAALVKKGLVAAGATVFVALIVLLVLYQVYRWRAHIWLVLGILAVLVLVTFFTDINRVSMHYFYRDRLSKAFIIRAKADGGALNAVESNDDMLVSDLVKPTGRVPYHLINATINLAGSDAEELRGRKGDFFLYSGLYCGSGVTGYQPTTQYADNITRLATAMAVSGAAANPQYGSRTSPALAFLMALLNARLGVWADNPRYAARHPWRRGAVRGFWPWYLAMELLSKTDERSALVDLSDGGHIENLGVYELLRRRCRVIIASDAGADPGRTFSDLGNLMRKARIDMGIQFEHLDVAPLGLDPSDKSNSGLSTAHVVIGDIRYPKTPESGESERPDADVEYATGKLLYVKAALIKDDPRDLHEYRARNNAFPDESTVDQFFDEAQFESYRELGYQSGRAVRELVRGRKGELRGLAL